MGVSVKNKDNPIGQFGTGLKYAIAGILRTGGSIKIKSGSEVYDFSTVTNSMRDHEFQSITCNGEVLAYTTDYGKHWEPWQWFRELYSNALDENGRASDKAPESAGVIIEVAHDDVAKCYDERHLYFLSKKLKPLYEDAQIQIFNRVNENNSLFFRGIRVGENDKESSFTFNFLNNVELTEDRTLKHTWSAQGLAARSLAKLEDSALIEKAIDDKYADFDLVYEHNEVSEEFLNVVQKKLVRCAEVNKDLVKVARTRCKIERPTFIPSQAQELKLNRVLNFLKAIDFEVTAPINFVKGEGDSLYGYAEHDEIFLTDKAFDHGVHDLAQTVLEEHIHIATGHADETRALQQYLFRQVIGLGEFVVGESL